jgi:ketosteroid isomerase-like protein
MTADDLSLEFVKRINAHDVDGLVRLMTPDHIFVDSLGEKSTRPAIEQGWRQYFEMVPDYWVRVERSFHDGETTVLVGRAGGTYVRKGGLVRSRNRWETPAVWVTRIRGGKVAEWRIYSDNEPIRQKMKRKS